jgi:hypothetical protein
MTAINLADSPSNGDTATVNGATYTYNSSNTRWEVTAGAGSSLTTEQVQDIVGDQLTTNGSHAGISFAYDDSGDAAIDATVGTLNQNTTGSAATLTTPREINGVAFNGSADITIPAGNTVYATMALLVAATGMSTGDMAYVTANNNLYLYTGSGWFKVATVENNSPTAITGVASATTLASDGTATVITAVSTDPEGFPLTWSYAVTTGSLTNGGGATATVSQADNVFTITPTTTEAYAGTFSITFSATDGTNAVTAASAFTLIFQSPLNQHTAKYTLYNPDPSVAGNFAQHVEMNDDYYVTANYTSSYGTGGKVYLFKRSDGTLAYTVTNTNENAFGWKFHIAGNWLAVTTTTSSSSSSSNKKILMYDISNFTGSTPATISSAPDYTLEDPSWGDNSYGGSQFGNDAFGGFSMTDEYVIASDYQELYPGTSGTQQWGYGCGIVYIWKIANFASDTTPAHDWRIEPPIDANGSTVISGVNTGGELHFGYSTAVKGDHLIVGSKHHLNSSSSNGGVFFQYDLSQLTSSVATADGDDAFVRYVVNPLPAMYSTSSSGSPSRPDYFTIMGYLQIDGDNLLIGVPKTDGYATDYGMAFIYDLTDGSIKHTIEPPFASSANRITLQFGGVVSIDADNVYIGSYDRVNSSGNPSSTGTGDHSLYHYDLSNLPTATVSGKPGLVAAGQTYVEHIFVERQYLDDHAEYRVFGYGGELIVGADNEDDTDGSGGTTSSAGVCYVYE